jgi:predicted CXXCH cytochrome family protein
MKKILFVFVTVLLILGWKAAQAEVANTQHDMFFMGKGTDPNICSYCHIPHQAVGDKIWSDWGNEAQLQNGPSSHIGNMCYTCHDGTATNIGQTTAFNTVLQQHKTSTGNDCDMCHTVHDNTNGEFIGVQATQSASTEAATYCETCHDATMHQGAQALGDHLAGAEHPYKDAGTLLDDSCNSCHQMHGAVNYTTSQLTNPILKIDNTDAAFCATCHADRVQNVTGGTKHPANLASAGSWGKVDCAFCHDPHQPSNPDYPHILSNANTDSGFCMTCHGATGTTSGPAIGAHTHPVLEGYTTVGLTPSGADIDDDGLNGPDYPNNTQSIVCESCHSPHIKGVAAKLVRISPAAGALCANCHSDK